MFLKQFWIVICAEMTTKITVLLIFVLSSDFSFDQGFGCEKQSEAAKLPCSDSACEIEWVLFCKY